MTALTLPNNVCPPGLFCAAGSINISATILSALAFNAYIARHPEVNIVLPGGGAIVVTKGVLEKVSGLGARLTPEGPQMCPAATYCYYGTGSPTIVADFADTLVHPRFCLTNFVCREGSSAAEPTSTSVVPAGMWAP
jgi:hypothetical protein